MKFFGSIHARVVIGALLVLLAFLAGAGLAMGEPRGIAWSPLHGLHLSSDLSLNLIVTAKRLHI